MICSVCGKQDCVCVEMPPSPARKPIDHEKAMADAKGLAFFDYDLLDEDSCYNLGRAYIEMHTMNSINESAADALALKNAEACAVLARMTEVLRSVNDPSHESGG